MWILPKQTEGFLDDTQKAQVAVLFNAIQPGDASRRIPDAVKAGAVDFIDLLLARDAAVFADIPVWRGLYPKALAALDQQATTKFNKPLQTLSIEEAGWLISGLETGTLVNFQYNNEIINQPVLFDTLRRHCIQGCFSDARWGGNKDKIMWKWYGYQEETKEITR